MCKAPLKKCKLTHFVHSNNTIFSTFAFAHCITMLGILRGVRATADGGEVCAGGEGRVVMLGICVLVNTDGGGITKKK